MASAVTLERTRAMGVGLVLLLACAAACGEDGSRAKLRIAERDAALTEITRLQSVVNERPSDHESLAKLATQQWVVGDYDNAQRSFARSLEISRDRATALRLVGLLYRRGRFVEAANVSKQYGLTREDALDLQWLRDFLEVYEVSLRHRPVAGAVATHDPSAELRNSIEMILLPVPGGRFERGCDTCDADARPVRSITVSPLLFGKYEVTVAIQVVHA